MSLLNILGASFPIIVILYLMIGRNWPGRLAGLAGWLLAIIVAFLLFGADLELVLVAFGRAVLLAFFVLYIIWMALLLFHVVNESKAIDQIGRWLPGLARDKAAQALLLGWVFGSFLQGASGFGVPAAVVAPLLVGVGFEPNAAVIIALTGHAWAVTYGSLGSSFFSLIAATGQAGPSLAGPTALMLGMCCLLCGLAVVWVAGRMSALRRRWSQILLVGLLMAGSQYILAIAGLWSLAAFGAGALGLLFIVFDLRFRLSDLGWRRNRDQQFSSDVRQLTSQDQSSTAPLIKAVFPYAVLTLVIVLGQLIFDELLSFLTIAPSFPEVVTTFGWSTPAGPGRSINLFGHAGALLLYASILSYLWFRWRPLTAHRPNGRLILKKAIKGSIGPTIAIVALVSMAVTMQHAGMTQLLAEALSQNTGPIFPFLSPFIGALGAFMTGSNTNSNVVFGELQMVTASALGLSIPVILAAQTAGGAIGSLFAPAKVVVGCSTVDGAENGTVLRSAVIIGLVITSVIGVATWLYLRFQLG